MVIQEARAEQEEPPAPGGRRGGRKPLLPFMLCWALPASRSLRSTGRAEPLPLGAAGGPGRCLPLPSLWGSGCRARGLPGNAPALPSFLPTGCPCFPGMAGARSRRLCSSFPRSPLPRSAEEEGQSRGMTHPALPGQQECGRAGGSVPLPPRHRQTPGHRHWMRGPAGDPTRAWGGISCSSSSSLPRPCFCRLDLPGWFPCASLGLPPSPCGAGAHWGPAQSWGPGVSGAGGRGDAGPGVGARRECGVL